MDVKPRLYVVIIRHRSGPARYFRVESEYGISWFTNALKQKLEEGIGKVKD